MGDQNQLPPFSNFSNSEDGNTTASQSLMQRVVRAREAGSMAAPFHFLDEQYRMHPHMSALVSQLFYEGPSRAKSASRSLRRALLVPQVNPGSLYRCSKGT